MFGNKTSPTSAKRVRLYLYLSNGSKESFSESVQALVSEPSCILMKEFLLMHDFGGGKRSRVFGRYSPMSC